MALFPCSLDGKRYPGKSNKAYLGWQRGIYSDRVIHNMCPFHMETLRDQLVGQGKLIERDGQMIEDDSPSPTHCTICKTDPVAVTWWAQLYDRAVGKEIFVVDTCDRCKPVLAGMAYTT